MYIFDTHAEMEKWFVNTRNENTIGNNFFEKHSNGLTEFWKNFNLLEIIAIATSTENAAYIAFTENYAYFKNFCNNAWKEKTLDLLLFAELTGENLTFINNMFPSINNLIIPTHLPPNEMIKSAKNLTALTINVDSQTVFETETFSHNLRILTITGNYVNPYVTSTTKILRSFPILDTLILNNLYVSKELISKLKFCKYNTIEFNNVHIERFQESKLIKTIMKMKKVLKNLTIIINHAFYATETFAYLILKLNKMKNLKNLTIAIPLRKNILKWIKNEKLKYIENLNIIQVPCEDAVTDLKIEKFINSQNYNITIEKHDLEDDSDTSTIEFNSYEFIQHAEIQND